MGIRRAASALRLRCEERIAKAPQGVVDGDSGQEVQKQDDDDRRNAARTSARACRRRFLCAVNEWNRKIVINAHTALVADCGGYRNEATHQTA